MSARQASGSNSRVKVLLGGGLGLVVVLFLVTRVLGGGGEEIKFESSPTPKSSTPSTAAPAATPGGATAPGETATPSPAGDAPVETFEVFSTKNPFKPLRTAKAAAPTASSTSGATAPAPAIVTAPAITPVSLNPVASTGQTATGGQATEPVRTTKVALVDVFVEGDRAVATVRVNDTVSKVGAGDSFSGNFRVVSLDTVEQCGRFLYGDDQFRLCRGEEVLK